MKRRKFLQNSLYVSLGFSSLACTRYKGIVLNDQEALAVNMWDYSWLLRTYNGGGFENHQQALDELEERGYNCLRIDAFPEFIGRNEEGVVKESYLIPGKKRRPILWGNEIEITIHPRIQLIQFLNACKQRGIKIILSSWFAGHGTRRNFEFSGTAGLIRAWNDTLIILKEENLLDTILYVDILNEYPLWHGYQWLHDKIESSSSNHIPPPSNGIYDFLNDNGKRFNDAQIKIYNSFLEEVLSKLKNDWPQLKFSASQTSTLNVPWDDLSSNVQEVHDIHLWMVYNKSFSSYTNYFEDIHILKGDSNYKSCYTRIKEYMKEHESELFNWLEEEIVKRKIHALNNNVPYGNTEGWGSVMWEDHMDLDWEFIKKCGYMGAILGAKHGMKFNCTSNFNHPHFGIWKDVEWHKKLTDIIKSA